MKYMVSALLLTSLVTACKQDAYIIDDGILARRTIYNNLNGANIIMGKAILNNSDISSVISQEKKLSRGQFAGAGEELADR